MKMYPIKMEIVNEDNTLAATVETFDENTATITLVANPHNTASWQELSTLISDALQELELEEEKS